MTPQQIEALRCLSDLEKELHRSWQRLDAEVKLIRHTTVEMLGLIHILKGRDKGDRTR